MKKKILALTLLIIFVLSLSVSAANKTYGKFNHMIYNDILKNMTKKEGQVHFLTELKIPLINIYRANARISFRGVNYER